MTLFHARQLRIEALEFVREAVVVDAVVFQMVEVAVPRELFTSILDRITRLKEAPA